MPLKKKIYFLSLALGLMSVTLPRPVRALCQYFRVSYRLAKCKEVPASEFKEVDRSDLQLPGMEEPASSDGKWVRVRCNCAYTLTGSDPRCDFDRNDEQESVINLEKGVLECKENKSLCKSVCPESLTE